MPAEHGIPEDKSHRTLIIVVAIVAAILIGGFFYLLLRRTMAPSAPPALEGAIRPGSPEFAQYREKIALDTPEADQATNVLGGFQMTLHTTVRNFTGRTIIGLELRAAVLDSTGKALKDRNVVVIPTRKPELEPNKTMPVSIVLEGMKESDDRARLQMEVVGFRLK